MNFKPFNLQIKMVDGNTATERPKEFTANWPPCRPWPSWPGSWGPACSSRDGAAGGAGGLHRWWCCAPGVGGQTCGRIHLLPQRQTYLFHLPHGWMRCHTPVQTHKDIDLYVLLGCIHNTYRFILQCRHRPLCHERSAGSSHVQTPG